MTSIRRPDSTLPFTQTSQAPQTQGSNGAQGTNAAQGAAATQGTPGTPAEADRFEGVGSGSSISPEVRQQADQALSTYQDKLTKILHHDAESMALGHTPARSTDDLSPEQLSQLKDASVDMLMEMPIGALSPAATAKAKSFLEEKGIDTEGFEKKTLKELGPVGKELGEKLVDDLKEKSPATFYGLGAAGAVAVGAYGYLKGSAALEKLGIKPKVDTELFNDQVKVRAEASWGEKLKDPNLKLGADGTFKVSPTATLKVGGNIHAAGPSVGSIGIKSADAHAGIDTERYGASGKVRFGEGGAFTGADVDGRVKIGGDTSVSGKASFNDQGLTSGQLNASTTFGKDTNVAGEARFGEGGTFSSGQLNADTTFGKDTKVSGEARLGEGGAFTGGQLNASTTFGEDTNVAGEARFGEGGRLSSGKLTADTKLGEHTKLAGEARFGEGGAFSGANLTGSTQLAGVKANAKTTLDADGAVQSGQLDLSRDFKLGPDGRDSLSGSLTSRFGQGASFQGLDATARYRLNSDAAKLDITGSATTDGDFQLTKGNAEARLTSDRTNLGFGVNYDRATDALGYKLDGSYKAANGLTLSGQAAFDRDFSLNQGNLGVTGTLNNGLDLTLRGDFNDGRMSGATGSVAYNKEPWKLSADVSHDFRQDVTTGSLSLGYQPRDNLDLQIRGSYDTNGDKRIGVGLTWRF